MEIKQLYDVADLPLHYLVELPDGRCRLMRCSPYRLVTEKDMTPCKIKPMSPGVEPALEWLPRVYGMVRKEQPNEQRYNGR